MNVRVLVKFALFVVGVLVLIQLMFYNSIRTENKEHAKQFRAGLSQQVEELSVTKHELEQYLAVLQREYDEIIKLVPEKILHGFDDQEIVLASFLDYLNAKEFKKVETRVALQGPRKYVSRPVPLFEHDLTFSFTFIHLADAREFLAFILDQKEFPLAVRSFELRNSGEQITGTLQASLLIPAKLQQTVFSQKDQEK